MTVYDELRAAIAASYDTSPAATVELVSRSLSELGCQTLLIALPDGSSYPVFQNTIQVERLAEGMVTQVVVAALQAVGVPPQQAQRWAPMAAAVAVQQARYYAAQRAARARAASAQAQQAQGARRDR